MHGQGEEHILGYTILQTFLICNLNLQPAQLRLPRALHLGETMIQLTDYLYSGDTVLHIIRNYSDALREHASKTKNPVDRTHANFLLQMEELLEHNNFLTSQSQRIREFYKFMAEHYGMYSFTFRGRIKSLIRAEEKFNGYIVNSIYSYHSEYGTWPPVSELRGQINRFKDLIAYRIVLSLPACHLKPGVNRTELEEKTLYEIANLLPDFLEERGFSAQLAQKEQPVSSPLLNDNVRPYYKDYIANPKEGGYRSLHLTLFDNMARSYTEIQLRTKDMDDFAEIGEANHSIYEKRQERERSRRMEIPRGECLYFDEAYDRIINLQNLDLSKINVNMFTALDKYRINDGCGLYYGRLILPYEHLSRFQNDEID